MSENIVTQYFSDLKSLLLQPKSFFRRIPANGGLTHPLAFALVTHWLGSALNYLWQTATGTSASKIMDQWMSMMGQYGKMSSDDIDTLSRNAHWAAARERLSDWIFGVGSVIADPFSTLFQILLTSVFVYLGARLLASSIPARKLQSPLPTLDEGNLVYEGAPQSGAAGGPVTYESAARIVSYATCAYLLSGIPFVGGMIATIYAVYLGVVGAREFYGVSTGRAILIALFPRLLFIGLVTFVIFGLIFAMIGIFAALFT